MPHLDLPLRFTPIYHTVVWGGRRMARWRSDLPNGPIGESWDLADHARGMSVVADGPFAGKSLRELTAEHGAALVGTRFRGGDFPLMIKLIDANDRLSVQVHPDDRLAKELQVGQRGKTECWMLLSEGELFAGTIPGTTAELFSEAVSAGRVSELLARHEVSDGDFVFLPARTVHALGRGCLLYEVQQTSDVTFRVDDWGRVGLDGKPRPLHVRESLATIDYQARAFPQRHGQHAHRDGGTVRPLATCPYFSVEERVATATAGPATGACHIITCLSGTGQLSTAAGAVALAPATTLLVPAAAGPWRAIANSSANSCPDAKAPGELRLLVATPVLD